MKTQLALVALLALSAFGLFFQNSPLQSADVDMQVYQRFVQWKSEHGKNYNNVSDEMLRFNIFSENYEFINMNNAKNSNVKLGLTQFADMTNEEFRQAMTTKIVRQTEEVEQHVSSSNATMQSVDWRSKGAVTDVKNQGSCGSCWAFATVATTEGLRAVSGGPLESLSNQQVTSCTNIPFPGAGGCNGGNTQFGWNYIKKNGIETDADYPYTSGTTGKTGTCTADLSKVVYKTVGQKNVAANSPQAMNDALQNQPLAIAVDAGSIYFQLYNSGVLKSENCGTELNHAITLVAYTANGDFWTVKNSWGNTWGLKGYIQMANLSGDGVCGMNMEVNYPTA